MADARRPGRLSRFHQLGVLTERYLVANVEPKIPWPAWFKWRIRRRMQRIYGFEAILQDRKSDARWLSNHVSRRFSQNGEDGIIAETCRRVGIGRGYFVEIGAADGNENCTRALAEDGWTGLWIEGDARKASKARTLMETRPVCVTDAFVTRENITDLLRDGRVPAQFDLLVVDIDGNDWWVLDEILGRHAPTVVALEYNPAMGLRHWVKPYDASHTWGGDRWYGASLASYADLLRGHGLTLVGTDPNGVNAFFVADRFADRFPEPGNLRAHFSESAHLLPFGHPWRHDNTQHPPRDAAEATKIGIVFVDVLNPSTPAGFMDLLVEVRNDSTQTIASSGDHPFHIAAWWGEPGDRRIHEPERFLLPWPARAGKATPALVRLPAPDTDAQLCLDIVQESVGWAGWSRGQDALAVTTIPRSKPAALGSW